MRIFRETPFGTHFLNIRSLIGVDLTRLLIESIRYAEKRFATTLTIKLNLTICFSCFDITFEFFQEFIEIGVNRAALPSTTQHRLRQLKLQVNIDKRDKCDWREVQSQNLVGLKEAK